MGARSGFVVVANRLPVRRDEEAGRWEMSPGGLVSALTPILQERSGIWVGWTGIPDFAPEPFEHEGIVQSPVPLGQDEMEDYYLGFCNGTVWPLYHHAIRSPEFHRHWWRPYETVNRRFAERVAESVEPDGVAWVHDYHLQLLPGMLRERRPDVTSGFFLHIPFPPVELFAHLPWRREILHGLLGADVVAFQTRQSVHNFVAAATRYGDAEGDERILTWDGRTIRPQWAPIAIDTGRFARLATAGDTEQEAAALHRRFVDVDNLLLGVDRLDYTKGIDVRLKAIATFFERYPEQAGRTAFMQIAVPSRESVGEYQQMREEIERLVGQINGRFSRPGYTPITYLYRALPQPDLVTCYRAADVMVVSPLVDGMNLVAKEYVASRVDDTGVLVLSEFAGAAAELRQAMLINPHDVDRFAAALREAIDMPEDEEARRMSALRRTVRDYDVFDWSRSCLEALGL